MSFQRFNRTDDIVENQRTTVTSGLWTGGGTNVTNSLSSIESPGIVFLCEMIGFIKKNLFLI